MSLTLLSELLFIDCQAIFVISMHILQHYSNHKVISNICIVSKSAKYSELDWSIMTAYTKIV